MRLREVNLDEFRSFRGLHLDVEPAGFRLVGPNASGKSTLLEAIAMMATTRSPRTSSEREIAHWRSGEDLAVPPYARLRGVVSRTDGNHVIEIGLSLEERRQGALKKLIRFDDRPVRAVDAIGQVKTVLFSPEDVDLIPGAPSARRRYLDVAISQASRPYLRALSRYGRVLEQRNSLLRSFARDRVPAGAARPAEELAFWDAELTASAADVIAIRLGAMSELGDRARLHYGQLTGDDSLYVSYLQSRMPSSEATALATNWPEPAQELRQAISASLSAALNTWRSEELRRGVTAIGPHRDDFTVHASGVELGKYGSRGQQRLALFAIKMAELDLMQRAAGEMPILLLDDVLSELDANRRAKVVAMLSSYHAQVCVTATDDSDLGATALEHLPLLRSMPGRIEPASA